MDFLAHLYYDKGLQYRSINVYRSTISVTHVVVDGIPVGSHPLIKRFMKGVFELRPPQPKYRETWNVSVVLEYLKSQYPLDGLTLKDLSFKLLALLAHTSFERANSLHKLDLNYRVYKHDGVLFSIPLLTKTSRPNKSKKEIFIPGFSEDTSLCVVTHLIHYERMTLEFRDNNSSNNLLFLSVNKPHKPVSSSTLSRWLKCILQKAGIDISSFQGHSFRSASSSAAASNGASIADILRVGDWSSESTFLRFYNRPSPTAMVAKKVLSVGGTSASCGVME